jgi:hypothetical protein
VEYISAGGFGGNVNCQNVGGTVTWSPLINNTATNTSQTTRSRNSSVEAPTSGRASPIFGSAHHS